MITSRPQELRRSSVRQHVRVVSSALRALTVIWLSISLLLDATVLQLTESSTSEVVMFSLELVLWVLVLVYVALDLRYRVKEKQNLESQLDLSARSIENMKRTADAGSSEIRRHIATWVHGSVQGALVRTKLSLSELLESYRTRRGTTNGETTNAITHLIDDLKTHVERDFDELFVALREKSIELWPTSQELPLRPALEKVAGVKALIHLDPSLDWSVGSNPNDVAPSLRISQLRKSKRRLSVQSRSEVVRIVEEAINNARKHGSTHERIEVGLNGNIVQIKVSNNGVPLTKDRGRGLGLLAINEIVSRHAGTWSLQNDPARGVTLRASFQVELATISELIDVLSDADTQ